MLYNIRIALIFSAIVFAGLSGSGFAVEQNENTSSFYSPILTKQQIVEGFEAGVNSGATHMLIVWDTYDYDSSYNFIVYSHPDEDVNDLIKYYDAPGYYRVTAVLAMHMDLSLQLSDTRWYPEYP